MDKLKELVSIDETIRLHKYDNGYMVELYGRNQDDDWITLKLVAETFSDAVNIINSAYLLPAQ